MRSARFARVAGGAEVGQLGSFRRGAAMPTPAGGVAPVRKGFSAPTKLILTHPDRDNQASLDQLEKEMRTRPELSNSDNIQVRVRFGNTESNLRGRISDIRRDASGRRIWTFFVPANTYPGFETGPMGASNRTFSVFDEHVSAGATYARVSDVGAIPFT